jgi:hypothetical protein
MQIGRLKGIFSIVAAVTCSGTHAATVLDINSTITNAGTCVLTNTCPESYSVTNYPGSTTQSVSGSASFGFSDSFNQGSNVSTGSNLGASATGSGAPWNFQDNILFTSTGASVQAQASALLTSVSDLQIRIISLNNPATGNPFDVTLNTNANAMALLGGSSVVTIQDGWTNFVAGPIDYTATMLNAMAAGSYIVQIRGEANPSSSYAGTISFNAVPLPASLIMLLSGLGLLGAATLRSTRSISMA